MNKDGGELDDKTYVEFKNFLDEKQVPENDMNITHARVGKVNGTTGKYRIETESDLNKFYSLYTEVSKKYKLNIVERQKEVGPLITDYDFVFNGNKFMKRKYTIDNIVYIVKILNKVIFKCIDIEKDDIVAYVTEKSHPTIEYENPNASDDEEKIVKRTKDGFHICYILPLTKDQRYLVYDKMKEIIINDDGFKNIPFSNKYEEIIDVSTIYSNGVMMYGSRKTIKPPYGEPYQLTHMYDYNGEEQDISGFTFSKLVKLFSLRQFDEDDKLKTRSSKMEELKEIMEKYNKDNKKNRNSTRNNSRDSDTTSTTESESSSTPTRRRYDSRNIKMARELVKIISPKLADSYDDWTRVGWTLHNIDESLFDDFIAFSKQCTSKFDYNACKRIWDGARTCGKQTTIASLHWWGQHNDPKAYIEIIWRNVDKNFINAESGTHADLGRLLHELYKYRFKCTSIKMNTWYEFQDHRWIRIEEATSLRQEISETVSHKFIDLSEKYADMIKSVEKTEAEIYRAKAKQMLEISKKLQDVPFVNNVIKACAHEFHDDKFESEIDEKHNLVGFKNGIFDLDAGVFRHGTPEDKVSLSTGYDWIEYTGKEPVFTKINEYFEKVVPNDKIRDYLLRQISSYIHGDNVDQQFVFWTGSGCHSGDTKILMYDGTIKCAQDVRMGDLLMGDDSTPRRVGQLFSGTQNMYEVSLTDGTSYIVNANHRLALKSVYDGEIRFDDVSKTYVVEYHKLENDGPVKYEKYFRVKDSNDELACKYATEFLNKKKQKQNVIHEGMIFPITVMNYIKLDDSIRKCYKNFRTPIEFRQQPVVIDPYKLGNTLGTSMIPAQYKFNSSQIRMRVLAGILDKFGSIENKKVTLNITNHNFMNECISLCRGLGYHVDIVSETKIILTGEFRFIGTKILNVGLEECNVKHTLMYDFSVSCLGDGKFYGFSVDKNQRYVLHNYIVTYNSNGKSLTTSLIKCAFGEYFATLDHTAITRKRGGSSVAAPELANKRGKRLVIMQESEEDDKLYVGFMKQLTGGDSLEVRTLFQLPFEYTPQFKMLFVCNNLPTITANDHGTWRRVRVVPFEAEFVDYEPVAKNQFKKDKRLEKEIKTWNVAFMWLLMRKYYPEYVKNGLCEPDAVKLKTAKYQNENDVCNEFIMATYEVTKRPTDTVPLTAFYVVFKTWYHDSSSGEKCPQLKFVKDYFEKSSCHKLIDGKITGLKMKQIDEDLTT